MGQAEHENLASKELINFHHRKKTKHTSGMSPSSEWFRLQLWRRVHAWNVSFLFFKLQKMSSLKVGQVEHKNLVLNELINFHHTKIMKLTFRAFALRMSTLGFKSCEVFMPEMSASLFFFWSWNFTLINLFGTKFPWQFSWSRVPRTKINKMISIMSYLSFAFISRNEQKTWQMWVHNRSYKTSGTAWTMIKSQMFFWLKKNSSNF